MNNEKKYRLRYKQHDAILVTGEDGKNYSRDSWFETAPMTMDKIREVRASMESDSAISDIKLIPA